jgi:16S rRNA (cytosine967-C5)-methyltransferase
LNTNLVRLHISAELVESDVRDFQPEQPAPFVLLDAPCSATGTIRRHPDLPWNKSAADINSCAAAAGELLEDCARLVAPGGTLIFAVCSLEPEEGEEQVAQFLSSQSGFTRRPIAASELFGLAELITSDGDLRTLPSHFADRGGMDGFYAARLVRG